MRTIQNKLCELANKRYCFRKWVSSGFYHTLVFTSDVPSDEMRDSVEWLSIQWRFRGSFSVDFIPAKNTIGLNGVLKLVLRHCILKAG